MSQIKLLIEVSKEASKITQLWIEGKDLPPTFAFDGKKWFLEIDTLDLGEDNDLDVFILFVGVPRRNVCVKMIINKNQEESSSAEINKNGYGFVRMFDIKPQ